MTGAERVDDKGFRLRTFIAARTAVLVYCTSAHTTAAWKASLKTAPPKTSSWRISMPIVFIAGPDITSTVAGLKGTAVSTDPRVATVPHAEMSRFVTSVKSPAVTGSSNELVKSDPRWAKPPARTTTTRVPGAFGQTTAR